MRRSPELLSLGLLDALPDPDSASELTRAAALRVATVLYLIEEVLTAKGR